MTSATKRTDLYSFDIQLNTGVEDRGFHSRNKKGEIQRPDIIEEFCQGLLVQARIDRIIHGTETKDGEPATLVVFGFRFHGINQQRRLREATITILFQDERKNDDNDPVVVALWPNGDFTLGEPTPVDVDEMNAAEGGGNAGFSEVGAEASVKWEKRRNYTQKSRAYLTGSIRLETSVRDYGPQNAVLLTISEDAVAKSGVVTDLRAAVLLRRVNDDKFTAKVKVKAEGNFLYNLVTGVRNVSGFSPANDPVVFKPAKENQYLRRATLAGFLETKLAEKIDEDNLNSGKLDELAGVLGSTALEAAVPE